MGRIFFAESLVNIIFREKSGVENKKTREVVSDTRTNQWCKNRSLFCVVSGEVQTLSLCSWDILFTSTKPDKESSR